MAASYKLQTFPPEWSKLHKPPAGAVGSGLGSITHRLLCHAAKIPTTVGQVVSAKFLRDKVPDVYWPLRSIAKKPVSDAPHNTHWRCRAACATPVPTFGACGG
eukprot:1194862-Prorocentrum_minimum.AAC.3